MRSNKVALVIHTQLKIQLSEVDLLIVLVISLFIDARLLSPIILLMHLNDINHKFRIRPIQRKISISSSLSKSQGLGNRKLSMTHNFKNQPKQMDTLQVPVPISPFIEGKNNKQLKRIIKIKELQFCYKGESIDAFDKDSKPLVDQPAFDPREFNQLTYSELIKDQDQDPQSIYNHPVCAFWPAKGKIIIVKEVKPAPAKAICQYVSRLKHKGIVEYYGIETINDSMYFYSQFLACGNLQDMMLMTQEPFDEILIKRFAKQLVETVKFIHQKGYYHGNIKPTKVLVDEGGQLKLSLVSSMGDHKISQTSNLKKIIWSSPERILGQKSEKAGDIWSIGTVILQMSTKSDPWFEESYQGLPNTKIFLKLIQSVKTPKLPSNRSKDLIQFLQMCLKFNPQDRSTIEELSQSSFISQI